MGIISMSLILLFTVLHRNHLQVWICIDQLINALLWGWADETLSARAYRCREKKRRWYLVMRIINAAVFWQDDHCKSAYQSEILRRHLAVEYRKEL